MIRLSLPQKKGGVGKTTLIKILAEWFSQNKRVLLVDFDDQCSLSGLYLPMERVGAGRHKRPPLHPDYSPHENAHKDWTGRSSSADIFYADRDIREYGVAEFAKGRLDILPADSRELVYVREQEKESIRRRIEHIVVEFFSSSGLDDMYDLIIFDTGPSESPLMRGVIGASTHTIIPLELEQQCVDGLDAIIGMVIEEQSRRAKKNPLELTALQINKFRKQLSLHKGLLKQIESQERLAGFVSPVIIPNRAAYAERDVRGLLPTSVFHLKPSDPARKIAEEWCRFVEKSLFSKVTENA